MTSTGVTVAMVSSEAFRILVINLDRSLDRFAHIKDELGREWPHAWARIPATDGMLLNLGQFRHRELLKESSDLSRQLTPGEVGAWLSHWRAWRCARFRDYSGTLILEDDIKLTGGFAKILADRLNDLSTTRLNWDVCFLGCLDGLAKWSPDLSKSSRLPGQFVRLDSTNGGCPGAYGYLLCPSGARMLLRIANVLRIDRPVDEVMRFAINSGDLTAVCASPPLVRHGRTATGRRFESTIAISESTS